MPTNWWWRIFNNETWKYQIWNFKRKISNIINLPAKPIPSLKEGLRFAPWIEKGNGKRIKRKNQRIESNADIRCIRYQFSSFLSDSKTLTACCTFKFESTMFLSSIWIWSHKHVQVLWNKNEVSGGKNAIKSFYVICVKANYQIKSPSSDIPAPPYLRLVLLSCGHTCNANIGRFWVSSFS